MKFKKEISDEKIAKKKQLALIALSNTSRLAD